VNRRHAIRSSVLLVALAPLNVHRPVFSADSYPSRPVKLIVPYGPGSVVDVQARAIAEALSKAVGQPIVVENRPGASGTIGVAIGAKAKPDGYTVTIGTASNLVVSPALGLRVGFDALKDFQPITQYSRGGAVLFAHPSLKVTSVQELIGLAKARPGELAYASTGATGTGRLAGELFQHEAGIKLLSVPYKTPAFMAVLGNEVPLGFDFATVVGPHVRSGALRALMVTGRNRNRSLPDVPTVAECGLPGAEIHGWSGVLVPAATPRHIVARLHTEIVTALSAPRVRAVFEEGGAEVPGNSPEEFRAVIIAEKARVDRIVRLAGIKVQESE
jgi:tripartite-type tricarboxylate transporter receptor subunit TctC